MTETATEGVRATSGHIHGVTLQIEPAGERQAESFTFLKNATRAVTIGRKSKHVRPAGFTPMIAHNALFLCPVVSRKHAKITFTEYGNVYITDLHSHHGTHIIRPNERIAKRLEPETATVLADGDIVIFGKSVGRDKDLVDPVTARVKLLFAPTSDNVAAPPPERISLSPSTAPGTSGRYGIYVSSDSSASSSDGDSDIEEIPPPPAFSPHLRITTSQSSQASTVSGRLQLLRNLLPAVPSSCVDEPTPTAFAQLLALPTSGATDADSPSESSSAASAESCAQDDEELYVDEPVFEPAQAQLNDWHGLYDPPTPGQSATNIELPNVLLTASQPSSPVDAVRILNETFPDHFSVEAASPTISLTVLEGHIQTAREDISLLRQIRSTDEERFEAHVRDVKARLTSLDEAMHASAASNPERDATLTDVAARMEALQDKVSVLEHSTVEVESCKEVSASLKEIKTMLKEIRTIRENSEKQIAIELEAVRAARTEAAAAATAAEVVTRHASNLLKRKRSQEDVLECEGDARVCAPVPKRRRTARRVAKMLVRTAATATVGAVAAWTALAFA